MPQLIWVEIVPQKRDPELSHNRLSVHRYKHRIFKVACRCHASAMVVAKSSVAILRITKASWRSQELEPANMKKARRKNNKQRGESRMATRRSRQALNKVGCESLPNAASKNPSPQVVVTWEFHWSYITSCHINIVSRTYLNVVYCWLLLL